MATTEATRRKTIKLVFTPQDHELGYRDYVADHDLSDSPSILKSIGNNAQREMNLLFRGRKVTPEEEAMTFEALMQKFHVSLDEEVLVFNGVVQKPPQTESMTRASIQKESPVINVQSTSTVPNIPDPNQPSTSTTTIIQEEVPPVNPAESTLPIPLMGTEAATALPQVPIPPQSTQPPLPTRSNPALDAAAQAVHQTVAQFSANQPIRQVQLLPIQYQAVLINGLPFLAHLNRQSQIRLTTDQVIPVTTHEGQPALIVSPAGVVSLAQQGYRVEVRVFAQPPPANQPQVPPPERRFGLTEFISLFRARLGQQLWLMCKLAFMVGIFSSNNASWRRIMCLCIVAAGIFFWQTGELERWLRRFRRPVATPPAPGTPAEVPPLPVPDQQQQRQRQEGPVSAIVMGLRLVEQILFVFVASLWPNAIGNGNGDAAPQRQPEMAQPDGERAGNNEANNEAAG